MTTNDRPSNPYSPVAKAGIGSSVLGWLHSLIAPASPAYRGDGQPVAGGTGVFGSTPSYRVPPPPPPTVPSEPAPEEPTQGEDADEDSCSMGSMTIVIDARD
jgi:hypothetical protein